MIWFKIQVNPISVINFLGVGWMETLLLSWCWRWDFFFSKIPYIEPFEHVGHDMWHVRYSFISSAGYTSQKIKQHMTQEQFLGQKGYSFQLRDSLGDCFWVVFCSLLCFSGSLYKNCPPLSRDVSSSGSSDPRSCAWFGPEIGLNGLMAPK